MAQPRSRTPLIIGVVTGIACLAILLLVTLVVVGGIVFWNSSGNDTDRARTPASDQLVTPPGVAADQAYLEVSTSTDGPVLDVYVDFLCPHCATFHDVQGEDLTQLAQDGEITLRMHPRSMLDGESSPEGYSSRAANAAVCAYAADPAQWFAAEDALFTDQPGPEGLSDEELSTRITEATGLDVTDCITAGTYLPWIEHVVEPEALEIGQGTPAVFINGEQFTVDFAVPGVLAKAIHEA